jgi:hypothetical protein
MHNDTLQFLEQSIHTEIHNRIKTFKEDYAYYKNRKQWFINIIVRNIKIDLQYIRDSYFKSYFALIKRYDVESPDYIKSLYNDLVNIESKSFIYILRIKYSWFGYSEKYVSKIQYEWIVKKIINT